MAKGGNCLGHVSIVSVGSDDVTRGSDTDLQEGWLQNPSLVGCCRAVYLREIRQTLFSQYRNRLSSVQPIVEDIVKLNIAEDQFVVEPDVAVFQRNIEAAGNAEYVPRDIQQFEDILVTDVDGTLPRNVQSYEANKLVVISGAGGQGKTTQMLKLAVDWASRSSAILSQFELLFYISLQHNSVADNLETLVCEETHILPIELKEKLRYILENRTPHSKHLFIIDGYEATKKNSFIQSLINGNFDPNVTVVVCGRPFWMKSFDSRRSADVVVDVKGISEKNVEQLCLNLLGEDIGSVNELMGICRQYLLDPSLLRSPMLTALCCYIFHANHAMDLQICNHIRPTSTTELFNAILRLLLMVYGKRVGKEFSVAFNHSPFDESGEGIPGNLLRLLYQISKLSFEGIKSDKTTFTYKDLKDCFIEPDELCHLGMMQCTSIATENCERNHPDLTFQFKHNMFQEYMAGIYIAKEASALEEIMNKVLVPARKVSGDDGYESDTETQPKPVKPKLKKYKFPKLKWLKKRDGFQLDNSNAGHTKKMMQLRNRRCPLEHADEDSLQIDLKVPSATSSLNLDIAHGSEGSVSAQCSSASQESDIPHPISIRSLPVPIAKKCLYNLLNPFQTAVLFACGANATFTKILLERCTPFTLAKVCKWNNDKYDVGYEAALFAESQDESLAYEFFKFFRCKERLDKSPSIIQFPSPYEESVTCLLAQSISSPNAQLLLNRWYNVNILDTPFTGANIVYSDSNTLELEDPCLFEMLLLHKFCHRGVTNLKVTGNYFPGFPELSMAFPNVKNLYFDGVNIPSPPRNYRRDEEVNLVSLHHMRLVNVHASFPFCVNLVDILQGSPELKTLVLQKVNCDNRKADLLKTIKHHTELQELSLVAMKLCFEDFVPCITGASTQTTIIDILTSLSNLKSLNLSHNKVGIAITGLVHALRDHKLCELLLQKCELPKMSLLTMGQTLRCFTHLQHIDLSSNPLAEKFDSLMFYLKDCQTLEILEIRRCSLSPDHFLKASEHMNAMSMLTTLDMSENNLSSAAINFLQMLPSTMKKLVAMNCKILSNDAVLLAPGLRKLQNLEHIDLQENPIQGGVEPILLALSKCKSLRVLNIRKCQLRPSHMSVVAKRLPSYENLEELTLGMNTCCDETKDARDELVKSLLKCQKLKYLRCCVFNGEPLTQSHIDRLKQNIRDVVCFKLPRKT